MERGKDNVVQKWQVWIAGPENFQFAVICVEEPLVKICI